MTLRDILIGSSVVALTAGTFAYAQNATVDAPVTDTPLIEDSVELAEATQTRDRGEGRRDGKDCDDDHDDDRDEDDDDDDAEDEA